jgi:hypothetical protein
VAEGDKNKMMKQIADAAKKPQKKDERQAF